MSDERAEDREAGISIRFIRSFDEAKFREECLRRDSFMMTRYPGWLLDAPPSRVCSGRERLAE